MHDVSLSAFNILYVATHLFYTDSQGHLVYPSSPTLLGVKFLPSPIFSVHPDPLNPSSRLFLASLAALKT